VKLSLSKASACGGISVTTRWSKATATTSGKIISIIYYATGNNTYRKCSKYKSDTKHKRTEVE